MSTGVKSGVTHPKVVCGWGNWRQPLSPPWESGQEDVGAHHEVWTAVGTTDADTAPDMDGSLKHEMKRVRNG